MIGMNDPIGFIDNRPNRLYRPDGRWRSHVYRFSDRDDFNDYIHHSDKVDRSLTWFKRCTLDELNQLDGYRHKRYESLKLYYWITLFLPEDGEVFLKKEDAPKYGQGSEMDMAAIFSLHRLQKEPEFTSPITMLITPDRKRVFVPGKTRRVFGATRDDLIDTVIFDYRNDGLAGYEWSHEWTFAQYFEMNSYDTLEMRSGVFHDGISRYGHVDTSRYYKFLEEFPAVAKFRMSDEPEDGFMARLDNRTFFVNDVPFARMGDDGWEMVPYGD